MRLVQDTGSRSLFMLLVAPKDNRVDDCVDDRGRGEVVPRPAAGVAGFGGERVDVRTAIGLRSALCYCLSDSNAAPTPAIFRPPSRPRTVRDPPPAPSAALGDLQCLRPARSGVLAGAGQPGRAGRGRGARLRSGGRRRREGRRDRAGHGTGGRGRSARAGGCQVLREDTERGDG